MRKLLDFKELLEPSRSSQGFSDETGPGSPGPAPSLDQGEADTESVSPTRLKLFDLKHLIRLIIKVNSEAP